jgi:thiamine-monophosphate kinase
MERDFARWLRARLPQDERLTVPAGDDAAVLRLAPGMDLVATTDMLMDGVDFHLGQHEPERIGRKALAVNLSDLAAMAARPVAALVSLALPQGGGEDLARRLLDGMLPLASQFACAIAGGDTNSWNQRLVISVTALGEVPQGKQWTRSGARPGDAIVVSGDFGGSIAGKHFDFTPRLGEAQWLAEHFQIHAAIDVSDGLSLDLSRLCESSACGAAINLDAVPISAAASQLACQQPNGPTALDRALSDGEDFELILALPEADAARLVADQPLGVRWTRIGAFIPQSGLFAVGNDGAITSLPPRGYEHRLEG